MERLTPDMVHPLGTRILVRKYRLPNEYGSLVLPGVWAQDNSRMAWEVVKSTSAADRYAGYTLKPDYIVITPPNRGVFVESIELPEIEVIDMQGKTTHERPGAWLIDAKEIVKVFPWTEGEEQDEPV